MRQLNLENRSYNVDECLALGEEAFNALFRSPKDWALIAKYAEPKKVEKKEKEDK